MPALVSMPAGRSPFSGRFVSAARPFATVPGIKVGAPARLWSGAAIARSTSGLIWVEVNIDGLNETLARWAEALGRDVQDAVVTVSLELLARIQMRTPVDTGRARNSWHVVLPGQPDSYTYTDSHGQSFDGMLRTITPPGPFQAVVGTNVAYMVYLEAGSSRQAPAGMVSVSLVEMRGALEAQIRQRRGVA